MPTLARMSALFLGCWCLTACLRQHEVAPIADPAVPPADSANTAALTPEAISERAVKRRAVEAGTWAWTWTQTWTCPDPDPDPDRLFVRSLAAIVPPIGRRPTVTRSAEPPWRGRGRWAEARTPRCFPHGDGQRPTAHRGGRA